MINKKNKQMEEQIKSNTILDLIIAHAPISAQSSNLVVFKLQPVYFYQVLYKNMLLVIIWIALTIGGNSNEYQQHMLL